MGIRKKRENGAGLVPALMERTYDRTAIPELSELPEGSYRIPDQPCEVSLFKGEQFNVHELKLQMDQSKPFAKMFAAQQPELGKRCPLLPLKADQIGLIGAAGEINGYVDGGHPHILKGRVVKEVHRSETVTQTDRYDRPTVTEETYTESNRLQFHILTQDGFRALS